jgi:hypothetical protein
MYQRGQEKTEQVLELVQEETGEPNLTDFDATLFARNRRRRGAHVLRRARAHVVPN